ncbi:MAG TPA: type 1 glutamine amidotransferase [Lapillicoccus sp.]|nr:type 1 glutamine amidotransferase [Lapillicoccus sp.]
MTPVVLVVQHQELCPPGWVGAWLVEEGLRLDVRHPYAGDSLPDDLAGHDGLLVLGGQMGANDDDAHPWLGPTKALIRGGADTGVPVLGICLGHQLAAAALGGEVVVNATGARRGVLDVTWGAEHIDDPVLSGCGGSAVFWHHDVVTRLPEGTRVLARAQTGELVAARYAPTVWGVQCHPEAGPEIVTGWAAKDRVLAAGTDEAAGVEAALGAVTEAQAELNAAWRPLATGFAEQVRVRASAAAR